MFCEYLIFFSQMFAQHLTSFGLRTYPTSPTQTQPCRGGKDIISIMTRESERSRTSAILNSIEVSRKLRRVEEEDKIHSIMMEKQVERLEEYQVFQRKNNTGAQPGGTQTTGRVKYEDRVWGGMLRDP